MIKVLLVDDEDIEREAMAEIIPWKKLDMELVDMAWNGIEGLEKIRMYIPDIVITDIKMPVMDGIQLIRNTKELYPDILFVVLSGYGEYGYTSRAMELGIRHYILKPCDEEKIVEVLQGVKKELAELENKRKSEQEYRSTFYQMLPRVKEQILGILITQKEVSKADKILLEKFMEDTRNSFALLGIRSPQELDQLDQFVLTNILTELLGVENIYMSTSTKDEMIYLIPEEIVENLRPLIIKVHKEYGKYKQTGLRSAISRTGGIEEVSSLYSQLQELFFLGDSEGRMEFISFDFLKKDNSVMILDYDRIREAKDYAEVMFEIYTSFAKMEMRGFSKNRIADSFRFFLKIFCEKEECEAKDGDIWELLEIVTEECAAYLKLSLPDTKDGNRMKHILYSIYQNIKNPDLSLQYLAKEVLFINEDYFGRFFYRYTNEKYSSFLVRVRVNLAKRLLEFNPDIRISELAEQTGYPADGQYFAKVFKKNTGMVPSEYRKMLIDG
ncbi:response regulator [Lachnoclostridium pacaense]|uniref:response regulator n=1 Tax=Enterocloster hominis (ex Hitch et al. 2024) TaxID=1917870 RepID=UPI001D1075F2|nr:response regulator [Lachnoclostridium pacaense]MCC2879487.1 response regulator [Lachnoclostridium pacaense]